MSKALAVRNNKQKKASSQPKVIGLPRFFRLDPFPPHMVKELSYSSSAILSSVASSATLGDLYAYRLNDMFDFNVTATGHQPYGFDQLCSSTGPYFRFKVIGVKFKLTALAPSVQGGAHIAINCMSPSDSGVATIQNLTFTQIGEKANTRIEFVPFNGRSSVSMNVAFPSLAPLYGLTEEIFRNEMDTTSGSYSSSPTANCMLQIGVLDQRAPATPTTVIFKLEATFRAMFYDRHQLVAS